MKGRATVYPKTGQSFDPLQIPKAIKNVGFTAVGVQVTADGTLVEKQGHLELNIPGLHHPYRLSGGPQARALAKRAELVGKKVRVTGNQHSSQGRQPPALTVEEFKAGP